MSSATMISRIFDCHLHVEKGLEKYGVPLEGANVIFNDVDFYLKSREQYAQYHHSLIFDPEREPEFYKQLIADNEIVALKIHSRLQKIKREDYGTLIQVLKKVDTTLPVIYDAFYFGGDLSVQPSLEGLIELIHAFPQRKFIVAHAGGYEVLKYFFHLKEFEQVGFDLSLSLQYLEDSSCRIDLVKLIRYIPTQRVFFGTDYPAGSPEKQLQIIHQIAEELHLTRKETEGILRENWLSFLSIN